MQKKKPAVGSEYESRNSIAPRLSSAAHFLYGELFYATRYTLVWCACKNTSLSSMQNANQREADALGFFLNLPYE
jgi:hypothetical protein